MGSGTGAWRFDPELPGEDSDDPVLAAKAYMIASLLDDLWNDMLPAEGVRIAAQQLLCSTAFSEDKTVEEDISSEKIVSGDSFEEKVTTKEGVTGEILDLFCALVLKD